MLPPQSTQDSVESVPIYYTSLPNESPRYFAITSTYPLPFFPLLTVPPFLACGSPIRSSILPAPLAAVGGLDGGADATPTEATRFPPAFAVGTAGDAVRVGVAFPDGGPESRWIDGEGCRTLIGGVSVCPGITDGKGGTGGVAFLDIDDGGGPPAALTALDGGPLGGGAFGASVAAGAGPFLLTHFFNSLS